MIIVLGGTSGIGLAMVELLREQGKRVLVIGKDHVSEQHGEGFTLDLTNWQSATWALQELERLGEHESIDGFIWSAGYGWRGQFADQPSARDMAEVNFSSALPFLQWAWQSMITATTTPSNLVIIGSTSSVKARWDEATYVATKHAQAGLARSLGQEAEQFDLPVRVALFLPGGTKTTFWNNHDEQPENYATFNDPVKIATEIVRFSQQQQVPFIEMAFPRGSLV